MLSDDHAVQAISACGSKVNCTTNIDRIAAQGAVFDQSFCCNSICTPSRAAILTGKHSYQNGVLTLRDALADDQVTFAGLLREAGYQTAIAGKWHLHSDPKDFDFWQALPGQGCYHNPDYLTPNGKIRIEGYSEDITTDTILDWLQSQRDPSKPFLACCQFKAPHRPWMPPERHYHTFDDVKFPEPTSLFDDYANRCHLLKENKMQINRHMNFNADLKVHDAGRHAGRLPMVDPEKTRSEWEYHRMTPEQRAAWNQAYDRRGEELRSMDLDDAAFTRWAWKAYLNDYLGCIQAIDDNVGRLLDYLDEAGLAENTIVVYCSDQGFYLGEHGWYDKRWIFEESMRMPLIIRWPGKIDPGTRYSQLAQNIDYAPTFLEACGVQTEEPMHGTSLLRVIEDGQDIHDDLYYHYYENKGHGVPAHDGLRNQRYKLVHFYTAKEFNLFDLEKDPGEMRSLHQDSEYANILADMTSRYYQARQRFEVPAQYGGE